MKTSTDGKVKCATMLSIRRVMTSSKAFSFSILTVAPPNSSSLAINIVQKLDYRLASIRSSVISSKWSCCLLQPTVIKSSRIIGSSSFSCSTIALMSDFAASVNMS